MPLSKEDKHWYRIVRRSQEAWWANDPMSQSDLEDMIEDELTKLENDDA